MVRTTIRTTARTEAPTRLHVTHLDGAPVGELSPARSARVLARSRWIIDRLRAAGVHGAAHVQVNRGGWFGVDVTVDVHSPAHRHPGAVRPVRVSGRSTRNGEPAGPYPGDVRLDVGRRPVGDDDDVLVHLCDDWALARDNLMWAVMSQLAEHVWGEVVAAAEAGVNLAAPPRDDLLVAFVGKAGDLAVRISADDPEVYRLAVEHGGRVRLADMGQLLGGHEVDPTLFEAFLANVTQAACASLGMDCAGVPEVA